MNSSLSQLARMIYCASQAALLFLPLASFELRAANVVASLKTPRLSVWIDDVELPSATRWEGGDPRLHYRVNESTGESTLEGPYLAPLVLDFEVVPPAVVQAWLKEFCARQPSPHRLVVTEVSTESAPPVAIITREYLDCQIVEARFIKLNFRPVVRISFQAASRKKIMTKSPGTAVTTGTESHHGTGIFTLEPNELRIPAKGPAIFTGQAPGDPASPGLMWMQAVAGERDVVSTPIPSSMLVKFIARNGRDFTGFALDLQAIHLLRFTVDQTETKPAGLADFELLVDRVVVTTQAETASATPSPTPSPTTSIAERRPTPTLVSPVGLNSAAVNADQPKTIRSPIAPAPTPLPVPSDPKDAGLRDPVQFPRPAGLQRTAFAARTSAERIEESAAYSSDREFDELMNEYVRLAKAEDWTETSRSESGDSSANRMTIVYWKRGSVEVTLRLYAVKTGAEAQIAVTLYRG